MDMNQKVNETNKVRKGRIVSVTTKVKDKVTHRDMFTKLKVND